MRFTCNERDRKIDREREMRREGWNVLPKFCTITEKIVAICVKISLPAFREQFTCLFVRCHGACIHFTTNFSLSVSLFLSFSLSLSFSFEYFIVFRVQPRTFFTLFFIVRFSLLCVRNRTLNPGRALCFSFPLGLHTSQLTYYDSHSFHTAVSFSHVHSIRCETFISIIT